MHTSVCALTAGGDLVHGQLPGNRLRHDGGVQPRDALECVVVVRHALHLQQSTVEEALL